VRVITGSAKGRKLVPVAGDGTRPITDRVKTALFNILAGFVEDARFLDLFAGTGGVGIEALSRGASSVVFVERGRKALEAVRRNLEITGLRDKAELVHGDAFHYVKNAPSEDAFDYVYVAPPQYQGMWAKMLLALDASHIVAADGQVIVQIHPKEFQELALEHLRLVDTRRYGSTMLCFYAFGEPEDSSDDAI
jgi:16S rRNA (guanine966-N2)-methyltransferase